MKYQHNTSTCKAVFATRSSIPEKPRTTRVFRRLSYYLKGGSDPTGRALDTTQVSYDSEADLGSNCGVDAFSDPTVSFFDLVESFGNTAAREMSDSIVGSVGSAYDGTELPDPKQEQSTE